VLAERVLDETIEQFKARKQEVEAEQASMKRSLSQLNQELARLAAETEQDSGARFDRIRSLEAAIRTAERRLQELSLEHQQMKENPVHPAHLRKTIGEFEEVWATLTTREQEELVKLLVSKVVYDGVTGKVTVSFRSAGAKELCQGKAE
jgi:site-specific DNA recombinase